MGCLGLVTEDLNRRQGEPDVGGDEGAEGHPRRLGGDTGGD